MPRLGFDALLSIRKLALTLWCSLLIRVSSGQGVTEAPSGSGGDFYPAMSLENPLNAGKLGLIIIGGTIQHKTRLAYKADANAGMYIGLGEPDKWIGAGITLNIYGMSNDIGAQNNLGQGTLNFHLNKLLFKGKLLLDLGVDNAFGWGGNELYRQYITYQRSFYFSGNYLFYLKPERMDKPFGYISITAGAGNGYFRQDKNYDQYKSGSFDPFLSLATPVVKRTNIIAEWSGYDFGVGIATIPIQKVPFMIAVAATDFVFGARRYVASTSFPFYIVRKGRKEGMPAARPVGIKAIRTARTI